MPHAFRSVALAAALAFVAPAPGAAQSSGIEVSLLHLEIREGDAPVQWIRVRNTGPRPAENVYVSCAFVDGRTPVASGMVFTTGGLAPGESETLEVQGHPFRRATSAECRATGF